MAHLNVFRYISEEGRKNLKSYKFNVQSKTAVDELMDTWWNAVANVLPKSLAPNVITLIGFLCTFFPVCIAFYYDPTLSQGGPKWTYWFCAVCLFMHQTLDAVDGKQARRLKLSSPLGQILDHGCDAFSVIFEAITVSYIVRLGISMLYSIILSLLLLQTVLFTWWEMNFSVFRYSTGHMGVTEGQLMIIFFAILSGSLGSDFFVTPIEPYLPVPVWKAIMEKSSLTFLPLNHFLAFSFSFIIASLLSRDFLMGFWKAPSWAQRAKLLMHMGHIFWHFILFYKGLATAMPVLTTLLILFQCGILTSRMHVSAACRESCSWIQWPCIPYYIFLIWISLFSPYLNEIYIVLHCLLVWSGVYLIGFIYTAIFDICTTLGVSCFSTSKSKPLHSISSRLRKRPSRR